VPAAATLLTGHTVVVPSHNESLKQLSAAGLHTVPAVAGVAPTQLPPLQASPVEQALPSSQAAVLSVWSVNPLLELHTSSVHGLPSSVGVTAVPAWQLPPLQVSPVVQASPSSQAAVLLV
jgi:hypothetical protein